MSTRALLPLSLLVALSACHESSSPVPLPMDAGDTDAATLDAAAHDAEAPDAALADSGPELWPEGGLPVPACADPDACSWETVAVLGSQTCALREDQTLWCWGENALGPTQVELRARHLFGLDGANHAHGACLLSDQGNLWCRDGARFLPAGATSDWRQIAVGAGRSCGVREGGTIACWESGYDGFPARAPDGAPLLGTENIKARAIALNAFATCVIDDAGALRCWDEPEPPEEPELDGGSTDAGAPTPPVEPRFFNPGHRARRLAMSNRETCVLREAGELACWGGEHAVTPQADGSELPEILAPGRAFVELSLSDSHGCALAQDSSLWCWGSGSMGELAQADLADHLQPVRVGTASNWRSVAVGSQYGCALNTENQIWCWGNNDSAALGFVSSGFVPEPWEMAPSQTFAELALNDEGGCSIQADGQLWCWRNQFAATLPNSAGLAPTRIGSASDWARVWLSPSYGCALKTDGTLWCWGSDSQGILTGGLGGAPSEPVAVQPSLRFHELALGTYTLCGIDLSGALWCWGDNTAFQFGVTDPTSSYDAVRSGGGRQFLSAALYYGALGVDTQGELWEWGVFSGSAGSGLTSLGTDYRAVRMGSLHWCALGAGGTLACLGNNGSGQLGLGHHDYVSYLTPIPNRSDFADVALNDSSTCALTDTGALWCWGQARPLSSANYDATVLTPAPLFPERTFERIALNRFGACAIESGGRLWCWGDNSYATFGAVQTMFSEPQRVALP